MSAHSTFFPDPSWPTIVELATEAWGPRSRKLSKADDIRFGTKGSKHVKPSDNTWKDFEGGERGGGYVQLWNMARPGQPLPPRTNGHGNNNHKRASGEMPPWENIAKPYDYTDADGKLIAQNVRMTAGFPHRFMQRRPNGRTASGEAKWRWSTEGLDIPLYRLPELRAAPIDEVVWLCEGEKDADRLHDAGLIATTNIGGAGNWQKRYAADLAGRHVVVLEDNDEAGRKRTAKVTADLRDVAASAKVLTLPGLGEGGDVSDWLDAANTIDELARLAREAPEYRQQEPEPDGDDKYAGLAKQLTASAWLIRDAPSAEQLLGEFITTATRCFIVGRTGLGKTLLGFAMAIGMALGTGFLHWRSSRPARVLYIDGEMPIDLLIERLRDEAKRAGRDDLIGNLMLFSIEDAEAIAEQYPMLGMLEPLNTDPGQEFIRRLCAALKPDVIFFDNVQALLIGAQKDEETWTPVLPLVQWLSKQRIAQIWIDHTGHNTNRQYGSSLKSWRFDVVGQMTDPLADARQPEDTAFVLTFDKARRRKPSNWHEFEPHIIRLRQDQWSSEPVEKRNGNGKPRGNVAPSRKIFHDSLIDALTHASTIPGETTDAAWRVECLRRDLIKRPAPGDTPADRRNTDRDYRKAKSDLQAAHWIGVDGDRVMDLTRSYR